MGSVETDERAGSGGVVDDVVDGVGDGDVDFGTAAAAVDELVIRLLGAVVGVFIDDGAVRVRLLGSACRCEDVGAGPEDPVRVTVTLAVGVAVLDDPQDVPAMTRAGRNHTNPVRCSVRCPSDVIVPPLAIPDPWSRRGFSRRLGQVSGQRIDLDGPMRLNCAEATGSMYSVRPLRRSRVPP